MNTQIRNAMLAAILSIALSMPIWAQEAAPPGADPAQAQSRPAAAPGTLEDMVELAQRTSPEVVIAEAQLREAEGRWRQARLEAAQKAIQAYWDQQAVALAREKVRQLEQDSEVGKITRHELLAARERLISLEAAVARSNAALDRMAADPSPGREPTPRRPTAQPDPVPRIRAERPKLPEEALYETQVMKGGSFKRFLPLAQPVSIEFENETLATILEFLSEYLGVNIVLDPAADGTIEFVRIRDIPLREVLLLFTRLHEDLCFIISDSHIFGTTEERAMHINAPAIPDTVPLYLPKDSVEEVWREAERERLKEEVRQELEREMQEQKAKAHRMEPERPRPVPAAPAPPGQSPQE